MKQYGYIRVSAKDQNPDRQVQALVEAGVKANDIFMEKISGKSFDRPEYKRLMKKLKQGDTLVIKSIDRLGRNYDEIIEQWRIMVKEMKINIKVLDMPLLNTDTVHENLTGIFIADLVLQILAYVAETERSFIRQRQEEGIRVAKENGIKFGTPKIELGNSFYVYYSKWKHKEISGKAAAEALRISPATFYRRCKDIESQKK